MPARGLAGGGEQGCWAYFESELIPVLLQGKSADPTQREGSWS